MHAHACTFGIVRTTIELSDEHRARLLELAARRGEKGFSALIGEALEAYFASDAAADDRRRAALAARGAMAKTQAEELRERCATIRGGWR